VELEIVATPSHPGMSVRFVLPPGVTPLRSNLPGVTSEITGLWTAGYAGVPLDGVTFRAAFARDQAAALPRTVIVFRESALPGGTGWQQIPAWLPQERAAWESSASYIVGLPAPDATPAPGVTTPGDEPVR
jgi:hypothetical protein